MMGKLWKSFWTKKQSTNTAVVNYMYKAHTRDASWALTRMHLGCPMWRQMRIPTGKAPRTSLFHIIRNFQRSLLPSLMNNLLLKCLSVNRTQTWKELMRLLSRSSQPQTHQMLEGELRYHTRTMGLAKHSKVAVILKNRKLARIEFTIFGPARLGPVSSRSWP